MKKQELGKALLVGMIMSFLVGLGVYYWQEMKWTENMEEQSYGCESVFSDIRSSLSRVQSRFCRDTDAAEGDDDRYVEGSVTYYDFGGQEYTVTDECSGSTINEMACSFDEDGIASPTIEKYECANGCEDGACVR